jgi:hypothetical protein
MFQSRMKDSQAAMLGRVGESHSYGTRVARGGLVVSMGNRRLVGYRILMEWGTLTEGDFLVQYGAFQCGVVGCWVCGR